MELAAPPTILSGRNSTLRFIADTAPPSYPLPDIRWAILQIHPPRLAGRQKPNGLPVHELHFPQIECYVFGFRFGLEELL